MNWSNHRYKLQNAAPKDREDVAAFVINDRQTGAEVHRESVPTGRMNDEKVADLLVGRRENLEKKYAPSRFDIESGLFNSQASFEHFFPTRSRPHKG